MTPQERSKLARRERQRGYMKKAYDRRENLMETLRTEMNALEAKYNAILSRVETATTESDQEGDDPTRRRLLGQFAKVVQLRKRLYAENARLYQANAAAMKLEGRLQQILDERPSDPVLAQPYQILPLPDEDYFAIISDTYQYALRFFYATDKATTGASIFGWQDRRKLRNDKLDYGLEKEVPSMTAFDILQRGWKLAVTPELYVQIYSPSMQAHAHILQVINESTVVMLLVMEMPGMPFVVKSVYVSCWLPIDCGYIIVHRSIDHDRLCLRDADINEVVNDSACQRSPSRPVVWKEMFSWAIFEEQAAGGTLFHFGGVADGREWLLEILFTTMRVERLMVDTSPLLCSS